MTVEIEYKESVFEKDLKGIDKKTALRIINKLEAVLSKNPNKGAPLKGNYKGLFKFRVGDYRVIYAKTENGVLVTRIRDRKDVYR